MKTVIILAEALSKAAFSPITRLDINLAYTHDGEEYYMARLRLADDEQTFYDIKEDGTITKGMD